jgi:hypothetical protein
VYQFFASEVLAAMGKDIAAIFGDKPARFFEIGRGSNFTIVLTTIGLFTVVGISVLVPVTILLQSAQRARSRNLVFLQTRDPRAVNPQRPSSSQQRSRLTSMQVWPVNYPKPVLLIAFSIVAATSYVFYRLTFVLLGICLVAAFRAIGRVLKGLAATMGESSAADNGPVGSQLAIRRPVQPTGSVPDDGVGSEPH